MSTMDTTRREFSSSLRIIWTIASKDIVDALRNKTTLTVIIGMTLVLLQSQALPLLLRLKPVPRMAVYDAAESRVIDELRTDRALRLTTVGSLEKLRVYVGESPEAVLGLMVPEDFDRVVDAGGPIELEGSFVHWIRPAEAAETQRFFEQKLTELVAQPVSISAEGNATYPTPDSGGRPFMVSMYIVVGMVLISAILVPYMMIEEKERHTMDVLLVSPASVGQIVTGKAIAGLIYGLSAAAVVLTFNRVMVVHWWLAILAVVCGALFSVGIGLLLGSICDNPQSLGMWLGPIALVLLAPMLLGLVMGSKLPGIVTTIIPWMPTAAMAKVIRICFSDRVPLAETVVSLGVVAGCAAALLVAVAWVVRRSDR